ncbi:MAG: helix-turn-helix transcriptional regulator [Gammaproteobacteria bacterium]|nr:helix-turn-helix transcriptional regulator [Gammaproteobacteria bacterium]
MPQVSVSGSEPLALSQDEKAFFGHLGARMAWLRKNQGITQVQMAEWLGVSRQTINAYEVLVMQMLAGVLARTNR